MAPQFEDRALIELDPLRHPSEMQQDIQFVRVSQEVTKRFYNLVGGSLSSPWYCSILFSTEKFACRL
jgi:hypothetical protein